MKFYGNSIDFIKMLPYYNVSCNFSFMERYADYGCKTETCPERNPLLVLFYLSLFQCRTIFSKKTQIGVYNWGFCGIKSISN